MADTKIEWADKSWNPVTGCTKVSQGCKNCYAERIFSRFNKRPFTEVKTHPHKLSDPFKWKNHQKIFVNSMSDLFHEDVPFEFIDDVFIQMNISFQHTYLVLTKRPEKMFEYVSRRNHALQQIGYPGGFASHYPNVWLGVSVEDQATADERIPILLRTPAAVRWISAEPLLGSINLHPFLCEYGDVKKPEQLFGSACRPSNKLDWVVVGGESGPGARPMNIEWARSLRDQCIDTKTAFFFKQWGEWLSYSSGFNLPNKYFDTCKFLSSSGNVSNERPSGDGFETTPIVRAGKKKAGRLLDGREWNEYPNQKRK